MVKTVKQSLHFISIFEKCPLLFFCIKHPFQRHVWGLGCRILDSDLSNLERKLDLSHQGFDMKCWSWVSICRSSWCTSHSKIWEEITWNWWIMSKVFHSFKICMATVSLLAFPKGKSLCIHIGLQDKILDWTGNQFLCDSWRHSYTLEAASFPSNSSRIQIV